MTNPLPAFVFWLCGGSAILVVALALPLWFRRVPPNWFYGARFAATFDSRDVWYAINARAGRNLVLIGAGYLLLVCAVAIDPRMNSAAALLGVTAAFLAMLIINTIALRRAAKLPALAPQREAQLLADVSRIP